MNVPTIFLVSLIAVLAAACSAASGSGGPAPSGLASSGPLPPDDILQPVIADAASRTGVAAGDVVVVSATEAEWPDGSLGCPQPGMMYTQALVSGFQIIVRAGSRDLDYRVRGPGNFRLCERP